MSQNDVRGQQSDVVKLPAIGTLRRRSAPSSEKNSEECGDESCTKLGKDVVGCLYYVRKLIITQNLEHTMIFMHAYYCVGVQLFIYDLRCHMV